MKILMTAAALAASLLLVSQPGEAAGKRYATPPPVTLSPDLASAWTLQIVPRRPTQADRWRAKRPHGLRAPSGTGYRAVRPVRRDAEGYATRRSGVARASVVHKQPRQLVVRETIEADLLPQIVYYDGVDKPGTLIVNTIERRLYLVLPGNKARRYAVGVGKPGFEWAGVHKVTRKAEWPSWRPPAEMIARERKKGRELPEYMPGGIENPLGARALYLGSTIYRIHGTNQAWSIGKAVSSGCIRMRNEDVMDLYERVPIGARVRVI